jgi:uracil phosphoribosyltransferase
MTIILNQQASVANEFLKALRDHNIQQNRPMFRHNMERLGEIMAYEISKRLLFKQERVKTSLGTADLDVLEQQPILITVLRAGIPFFQGFQRYFDSADCGFIGAYRKEGGDEIAIKLEYVATPSIEGKVVLLIDPMLATGKSVVRTAQAIEKNGKPAHIHVASLVASPEGIDHVEKTLACPHTVWAWALDEKLNDQFYIVPGLGDAGDLSFGEKKL